MVALTFFSRIPTTSSVDFFLKSGSGRGAGAESRSASERGWAAGLERMGAGSGCDWNHKNVRYKIELDVVESASTDLSLRYRWRITFVQMAQRPTGNMILQCLGHFRSSNTESLIRLANATLTP